jgi:hypothetical protein
MTTEQAAEARQKPLRLWPGILAVVLQWLTWLVLPIVAPEAMLYAVLAGVFGGGLAVVLLLALTLRYDWLIRTTATREADHRNASSVDLSFRRGRLYVLAGQENTDSAGWIQ